MFVEFPTHPGGAVAINVEEIAAFSAQTAIGDDKASTHIILSSGTAYLVDVAPEDVWDVVQPTPAEGEAEAEGE